MPKSYGDQADLTLAAAFRENNPTVMEAIRFGLLAGYDMERIEGHSTTIDASGYQSVAQGLTAGQVLGYPSGMETLAVASSSADDVHTTGTGGRTLTATTMDTSFVPQDAETVNLNGQTKVTLGTTGHRVINMALATAGSGERNAGTIYIGADSDTWTNGVPSNPYGVISVGDSQMLSSVITIAAGYEGILMWRQPISPDTKAVETILEHRLSGASVWLRRPPVAVSDGGARVLCLCDQAIPAGSDVRIMAKGLSAGAKSISVFAYYMLRAV